jgi:hypothetical protein
MTSVFYFITSPCSSVPVVVDTTVLLHFDSEVDGLEKGEPLDSLSLFTAEV